MKKQLLFLPVLFFITFFSKAQSFEWLQTVDVEYEFNPEMIRYSTCADPQGGSYLFGIQEHVAFYNQSMGPLFLKRYNQQGEETWSRTMTGQSSAQGVFSSDNGDVYIIGEMYTDLDFWGEDTLVKIGIGTDGFLAKVNNDGDLEWAINLSELPMGEGSVAYLAFDEQDWLYAAYSTWQNSYVLIFNPDGEFQQSILQGNVALISSLDFDDDGNLYAAGSCAGSSGTFGGVPFPAPFSYTTYLVKYNADLQPVWVKFIEDITCTFPQLKVDDTGWIYFAGQLFKETLFDEIPVNGPSWTNDFFLARLNPDGQFQWVAECPEVLTGDATIGSLHFLDIDPNGNALLTGIARGIVDWGNGVVSDVTENYQDIIIWSYAPDGLVNWVKTAGGTGYELAQTISADFDGGAYLAGVISGTVVFDSITRVSEDFTDPFLTRLDLDILSATHEIEKTGEVMVYPNPATDKIFIHSNSAYSEYRLFNSTGHFVRSGNLSGGDKVISVEGLPAGLYLLTLKSKESLISYARVMVL